VRNEQRASAQRAEVTAEIKALLCGATEDGSTTEILGLLPIQDRLEDLRRRLEQIESLISATAGEAHESEKGWSPELGDPLPN
jgi:hypothetical protein